MRYTYLRLLAASLGFAVTLTLAATAESAPNVDKVTLAPSLKYLDELTISGPQDFLRDSPAINADGTVNFFAEIPTGTNAKWEVKTDGKLHWDMKKGKPRIVQYLSYVGNYGMVPQTVQGDDDPIDMIVLAPPLARGAVVPVRLIGAMKFTDGGEQDNKLIAVLPGTPLGEITSLKELDEQFPGVTEIVRVWFEHYKGLDNKMKYIGAVERAEAERLLQDAHKAFDPTRRAEGK